MKFACYITALASLIIVIGISMLSIPSGIAASGFAELVQKQSADKAKNYYPYSGDKKDDLKTGRRKYETRYATIDRFEEEVAII